MDRIRIIQLVSGLAVGDQSGGAELFGAQLARCLDKSAFEVMVCSLWRYDSPREQEWLNRLQREDVRVVRLVMPTGRLGLDIWQALSRFWSLVGDYRPQLINSHSERGDMFNLLAHLFHPVHPHAARTMHTDQQWQSRPWLGTALLQGVFPVAFDAEFAISEATRQVLDTRWLARLYRRKSVLCYNGIDEKILPRERLSGDYSQLPTGVPARRPRIGIIGRLSEQKGHVDIIDAMEIVRQWMSADLLIIGAGPLAADLRQRVIAAGLSEYVHFLGSRNDVMDIFTYLDLVVSASWWEGFPSVILEAMAAGVPVVATDVSGSRELVKTGTTGILVPPHDPTRLADAIMALLQNPTLAQTMADAARQSVAPFTIQNATRTYADLYKRIICHT